MSEASKGHPIIHDVVWDPWPVVFMTRCEQYPSQTRSQEKKESPMKPVLPSCYNASHVDSLNETAKKKDDGGVRPCSEAARSHDAKVCSETRTYKKRFGGHH